MGSLSICDCDDCYQSENDTKIYHVDYETEKFLIKHFSHVFNSRIDDICKDCIDEINTDYEDFFIIDEYGDLSINEKYLNNINLLK